MKIVKTIILLVIGILVSWEVGMCTLDVFLKKRILSSESLISIRMHQTKPIVMFISEIKNKFGIEIGLYNYEKETWLKFFKVNRVVCGGCHIPMFHPTEDRIFIINDFYIIKVYDFEGKLLQSIDIKRPLQINRSNKITSVRWHNKKSKVLTFVVDGNILVIFNTEKKNHRVLKKIFLNVNVCDISFNPFDCNILAASCVDGNIRLIDVREGSIIQNINFEYRVPQNRTVPFFHWSPYDKSDMGVSTGEFFYFFKTGFGLKNENKVIEGMDSVLCKIYWYKKYLVLLNLREDIIFICTRDNLCLNLCEIFAKIESKLECFTGNNSFFAVRQKNEVFLYEIVETVPTYAP
jgi:hypothetical protein